MKLYDSPAAPNCRRVRVFLAEKAVEVPTVAVDLAGAENRRPPFTDKNPMAGVPVLELDDGSWLAESVAICRYFEELKPDPPLFGSDGTDRARVEMWNRRMEFEIFTPIAQVFRQSHEFFKGRIQQVPAYGEACRGVALQRLAWLDSELAEREFVAGDRISIADVTALCGIDFGRVTGFRVAPDQKHLTRWHEAMSARPSAQA